MADTALQNAEKRRDEIAAAINQLQAQIEEKRKELERIKTFIADYAVFQSYPSELPLELQKTPSPAPRLRLLNHRAIWLGIRRKRFYFKTAARWPVTSYSRRSRGMG